MQRFWDIVFSVITIILLSPVFIVTIIILRLTGEGEIFFSQSRIGMHGKEIKIFKFSTMLKNSPNTGAGTVTLKNDPRVLPFGKLLRKSKINELPQIVNILLGDISFVGPRPLTPNNFSFYDEKTQEIINRLKPGLTGIGSIVFRDEESVIRNSQKNPVDCYKEDISPYKGELERWFYKKQSIFIYFTLIFLTVNSVLFPSSKLVWRIFKDIPLPKENIINFNKR